MKKFSLVLSAAAVLGLSAHAGGLNFEGLEFTPTYNFAKPEGNLDLKNHHGFGGRLGYMYNSHFGTELGYENYSAKFKDADSTKVRIHRTFLNALLPFRLGNSPIDAYLMAGLGYEHFSKQLYDNHDGVFFHYGAGLKVALAKHLGLRFEVRDQLKVRNRDHHLITTAGLMFSFGGKEPAAVPEPAVEPAPAPAAELPKPHRCYDLEQVNVYFDFDKSAIKPEYAAQIKTLAEHINEEPAYYAYVRGYTDSVGSSAYNQKLSERRANAAKAALVNAGVAADRVNPSWYGKDGAIADNSTKEGRAKNRRVELKIICQ